MISQNLRVTTYNLWSNKLMRAERALEVLRLVSEESPDFAAFQEVTEETAHILSGGLGSNYETFLDLRGGLMICSRLGGVPRDKALTSPLGRTVLWLELQDLAVATVHLESRRAATAARMNQLYEVMEILKPYSRVVLVGDFNFCGSWPEDQILSSRYRDAWPCLHPDDPGYTEDTKINLMRLAAKGKEKQVRFDRVFCRGALRPIQAKLLGHEPLPDNDKIWPSDHAGLSVALESCPPPEEALVSRLLLLGQDCVRYGDPYLVNLGTVSASLCVGSDRHSPSLAFKADPDQPNEDGLLVVQEGALTLLAVADAHFGVEASHALLSRMAKWVSIPDSSETLLEALLKMELPLVDSNSATTLSVVVANSESGQGFGWNVGDSSICVIKKDLEHQVEATSHFLGWTGEPWQKSWFEECTFSLESGDLLLLFTDGVNECHYRSPRTSITAGHIETLWHRLGRDPEQFVKYLTTQALDGVMGAPGGQDNIAILALRAP